MAASMLMASNLILLVLRKRRGWSALDLARAVGLSKTSLSYYETGRRRLRLKTLLRFARAMGYSDPEVYALLFGVEGFAGPVEVPPRVAGLSPETLTEIRQEVIALARGEEAKRIEQALAQLAEKARAEAGRQVRKLAALPAERREAEVLARPEWRTWAGVEGLAHESVNAAANDPWQAIGWAELARQVAEKVSDPRERNRLLGYAWAYLANARRVTSDLLGADQAFVRAWKHWKTRRRPAWCPVEEWRLFDLEASLRRAQRDCEKALALHRRVLAMVPREHRGRVLLNMTTTFKTAGDVESAIPCLREAEQLIDSARDPRLRFVCRLNLAGCLALCERVAEAEDLMPEARQQAIRLRNEVDLTRTLWVQSWIDLAAGRRGDALAALDQVREDFCTRRIDYDAALATLELAVLLLEDGDYDRVRALAVEIYWVFASRLIRQEALASLQIFYDAVRKNEATVALARRVLEEVRETERILSSPD